MLLHDILLSRSVASHCFNLNSVYSNDLTSGMYMLRLRFNPTPTFGNLMYYYQSQRSAINKQARPKEAEFDHKKGI